MKNLRYICCQPATLYYTWQVEVLIHNFIKMGVNPNYMDIVCGIENNIVPKSNLDFSGPGVLGKSVNKYLNLPEETPFVNKEGIINDTIKLLHFEYGTEYIKDIDTNKILFQNKNGNKLIQDIYKNELARINHIDWGTCRNPIQQEQPNNISNALKLTNSYIGRKFTYHVLELS